MIYNCSTFRAADAEPEPELADPEEREARVERAEGQAVDQTAYVSITHQASDCHR